MAYLGNFIKNRDAVVTLNLALLRSPLKRRSEVSVLCATIASDMQH